MTGAPTDGPQGTSASTSASVQPAAAGVRARPLQGLRVLDFTSMIAGPYCTRSLADMGCDVIKIEAPEGDYIRQRAPLRDGHSAYFGHLNAGKRSVMLDLRKPQALDAVLKMVPRCDVVVENMRPGAMRRLGLGYDVLAALNPRLVYCSISGFGQTGPDAARPAYAPIVQAASGYEAAFASYQGGGTEGRPLNIATFVADILGGLFAQSAVLAALQQRHATGTGQYIDTSLFESMLQLMPYEVQEAQFPAAAPRPVYPPLRASDGYLMVSAISPRNFEALLDTIAIPAWRDDPVYCTEQARQTHWVQIMARVEAWTTQRSCDECLRILGDAGVPITRYQTVREAINTPQLEFRQALSVVRDAAGAYRVPKLPFQMSAADIQVGHEVPALGQHTREVLVALAGLDAAALHAVGCHEGTEGHGPQDLVAPHLEPLLMNLDPHA